VLIAKKHGVDDPEGRLRQPRRDQREARAPARARATSSSPSTP
jgi:hypothetical protein